LPRTFARQLADGTLCRVVLTGMGGSYSALYPLLFALIARGLNVSMMETSELIHHAPALIRKDTLLVTASQSGRSAEIVQLVERAQGHAPIIGVTNTADSPLAIRSDAAVITQAGEEFSVACKTFVTMLAALAWLGDRLTEQAPDSTLTAIHRAADATESYLTHLETHVDELSSQLTGVQNVYYVGRGASLAAVGTGALITKEAARVPAEGMSSAAFRHGPLEVLTPQHFVVVYEGAPPTVELNQRLASDIRALSMKAAIVSASPSGGVFALSAVPEIIRPILEILPAQMVTLALAQVRGHEAGTFARNQKVTTTE
jgi:glucosamine--fructose-6-phosphate aminotransferase (isomerizing)